MSPPTKSAARRASANNCLRVEPSGTAAPLRAPAATCCAERLLARTPGDRGAEAVGLPEPVGDLGKGLRRPQFRRPAAARVEDREAPAEARQLLSGEAFVGGRESDGELVGAVDAAAQVRCQPEVLPDDVRAVVGRDALGEHQGARRFAQGAGREADAARRAREPGDEARLEEPLKVERDVKSAGAQPRDRRPGAGKVSPPAAQVELDQFIERGVVAQDLRRAAAPDGPGDAALRQAAPERRQGGQRADHVADRPQLDDQNIQWG